MRLPHARNLIDGGWAGSGPAAESIDPATGEVIGTFADGGAAQARAAIGAARRAFTEPEWSRDRERRAAALRGLADRMSERRDDLIAMLTRENGKKLADAAAEVDSAIPKVHYYAALALTESGRAAEVRPGVYSMTLRQPIGVAGVIVPWNAPVVLAIRSLAPALAAGCTVVLKMPAQTALTNGLLYETIARCFPPGTVNAFTESAGQGARLLVADPDVDVISYTGGTATGRAIMARAAERLKAVSLELGGKTPMLVFEDADLAAAVPVLTAAVTTFAGQFCMAGTRVLAHRAVAGELRERLSAALEAVVVGRGDDPATQMGPLVDRAAAERVDRAVEDAARYAKILVRGGRVPGPGAFCRPSLIEVQDVQAPVVQQEIFGPVATFEVFDDEAEAVARANATDYGLAASIWTRDVDRPLRVAREIDAGTVWTNTWAVVHDQMEEGGFKQSGLGRLNGPRGLEEFQELKHLARAPVRP